MARRSSEQAELALPAPEELQHRIFLPGGTPGRLEARRSREAQLLERMLAQREQWVAARRARALAQLERFIAQEPASSEYLPDALLRLAELRWEQARMAYFEAYEAWQREPEASRSENANAPEIAVPIELYDRILANYPAFERYDLVLYMKAYALIEAGRTREALFSYRRIIEEFPGSRFVPDAHTAFGEWHFSGEYDYAAALAEYEQVLSHPDSELSDLALFKSAWCLWKLGRTADAAQRFREVLDLGDRLHDISGERRRRLLALQDEALEYLIQVFTQDESNTAADLHGFLSQIGGEQYATKMLRRLSRAFFDQSRWGHAMQAYSMLLESEPDSPQAPEYQAQIAASHAAQGDASATVQALQQLARGYRPGSAWALRQADPESAERAARIAERVVRAQAMRYHERGQLRKQRSDFEHAAALYRLHAAEYPDSGSGHEVAFYLGEILLHHLARPAAAGRAYLRAGRLRPNGQFTRDALYNAVVAFERVRVQELEGCKPPSPDEALPPECRETATDHSFSEAVSLYVARFPNDPEIAGILFRQGRMYFERGVYDPAVRQFGELLRSHPNSEYAAAAGALVLESCSRANDPERVETWARELKHAPAFQSGQAQRDLDLLILRSVFEIGDALAERRQHEGAARAYARAAREFPQDARAARALFDAGQQWQRAGKLEPAAEAYNRLIAQYPGSEMGALAAWTAAQMFEAIAQFRDAAHYYEAYAQHFPKGDKRADALHQAVLLRLSAGDHEEAARDGRRFAQLFPRHAAGPEVMFMLGRSHAAGKRYAAAAEVYRNYARARRAAGVDRRIEANTRLAQVLLSSNDPRGAARALKNAIAVARRSDERLQRGRYFAAQAQFMQAEMLLAEFERIPIGGDPASLTRRLERKSELLRKAASAYGEVLEFQEAAWVTAALYAVGRSYERFAHALRATPPPPGSTAAQAQAYRDRLMAFSVPIDASALEAYERGYRKALELRMWNRWTQKLREALTRLDAVEYPPLREIGVEMAKPRPLNMPTPLLGLDSARSRRAEPSAAAGKRADGPGER